jgi:3-methyladenine DNA glycosylase AlkD
MLPQFSWEKETRCNTKITALNIFKSNDGEAMNLNEAMKELEALGSEQTRKTWHRHGAVEPMFGVKFGDLAKLQKRIKVNHSLATELWKTENHDARLLACMAADASAITEKELKAWASTVKDSSTAEALANLASRTPLAAKIREVWLADPKLLRAGWSMVGRCAKDGVLLDEAASLSYIKRIEAEIHKAENWTRRTMMYALIGLGGAVPRHAKLPKRLFAVLGRLHLIREIRLVNFRMRWLILLRFGRGSKFFNWVKRAWL